jgi:hypothetical protein
MGGDVLQDFGADDEVEPAVGEGQVLAVGGAQGPSAASMFAQALMQRQPLAGGGQPGIRTSTPTTTAPGNR